MAPGVMWTKEDCDQLNQLVERHGKKWTPIAACLGAGKTGKQCRRQWERLNILTKQCGWAPEEDALLLQYHRRYGNKWTRISKLIGGRTDNAVKNRYHALKLKHRAKCLTRVDASPLEEAVGERSLKNCNSLEERRAAKQEAERIKVEEPHMAESGGFKTEALPTSGFYSSFQGGWTGGCFPPTTTWTQTDVCKIPCSSTVYGVYAPRPMNNGQPQTCLMNLASNPVHSVLTPSMVPDNGHRLVDDEDSMESTSENKQMGSAAALSEGLSTIYGGTSAPFFLETNSQPLPSRVMDGHQQLEMLSYSGGLSVSGPVGPVTRRPDLTIDLSFQQREKVDFDSILHSVSPSSPTAYLRFLNVVSPLNRQSSYMSDHDSHMKA